MSQRADTVILDSLEADPSSPEDGEVWYNATSDKLMARENGVSVALSTASGAASDQPAVSARRTTALATTASFVDVTLDSTDVENDTATVEHDDTNTDRITLKNAGLYLIAYHADIDAPPIGTTLAIEAQVRANDTTVLDRSDSRVGVFSDSSIAGDDCPDMISRSFLYEATADDFITLQLRHVIIGGSDPTNTKVGLTLSATRLTGTKGDQGDAGAPGFGVVIQTKAIKLAADQTTTSTSFVDLVGASVTLTIGANPVIIMASVSASISAANNGYQIEIDVDGSPEGAAGEDAKTANKQSTTTYTGKTAVLTAGAHTVKIRWRTSGGTLQCRPSTNPTLEHASLVVMEVSG